MKGDTSNSSLYPICKQWLPKPNELKGFIFIASPCVQTDPWLFVCMVFIDFLQDCRYECC